MLFFFGRTKNVSDVRLSSSVTIVFILFTYCNGIQGQEFMCCSHVTGTCKNICEKISLVEIASNATLRIETLEEVETFCSAHIKSFWECVNATFKEISRGEYWSGRVCCPLPQSETCRRTCVTATSLEELTYNQGCRQSDELAFFSCLERQSIGEMCCAHARTNECRNACFDIFKNHLTPTKQQRNAVVETCQYNSPKVLNCVKNYTRVTPVDNIHKHLQCCDKSNKSKCREVCKNVLTSDSSSQEIIDSLQTGGCGPPLLQDHFWQCFLKPESNVAVATASSSKLSRIDRVGMDSAKWHCCQRASSNHCRKLCSRTFTKDWATSWDEFHMKCLSHKGEDELKSCIEEVDEPCELGCDGLNFCTNFNNRPTELFRSCTPESDEAARNDFTLWQSHNELALPGLSLPLKNISQCSPDTWKAVACTLQIKPCSRHDPSDALLCRDVCLQVLSRCADWQAVSPEHTAETVCNALSPSNNNMDLSCIPLQKYLHPSENNYQRVDGQVSFPCKGNPCEPDETCTVKNHNECAKDGGGFCRQTLPGYTCTPGCKLGEVSEYAVPSGIFVRIPIPNNPKGCLKICQCSDNGRFEDCRPLPCVQLNNCWMGDGQQKEHGSTFELDCNTCSCFAGEIVCSKKQCHLSITDENNDPAGNSAITYTTLPCNCPPHYVPVCGRNGVTYPSSCLAKCAGLNDGDLDYGGCGDPCKNHPCPIGHKCISNPQICLSLKHKPCLQYQCINGTANCKDLPFEPVCDIDNKEYANACLLAHHSGKLAYRGPCLNKCRSLGEVCGINGRTYTSECAAWSDFTSVDYKGPCVAVGLMSNGNNPGPRQCDESIQCAALPDPTCFGTTPPGACCPVCAGAIRILYSKKQVDRALYIFLQEQRSASSLTLQATLKALERQVQVAQCVLRGYLTIELDIFILLQTTEKYPSELQLEACVREAEKIANLINRQSPRIASELSLSSLIAATVVHSRFSTSHGWAVGMSKNLVLIHSSFFVAISFFLKT